MEKLEEMVTIQLQTNVSVTVPKSKVYTINEWKAEAIRRYGEDPLKWRFRCSKCKRQWSLEEYFEIKKAGNVSNGWQECCYCDWVSYGLLGTLGDGLIVTFPEGAPAQVFNFADAEKGVKNK